MTFAVLNPLTWWGPLLTRELRVQSRRKRLYALRSGYLLLLSVVVVVVWTLTMPRLAGQAALVGGRAGWMAQVARHVTATILWLQFLSLQVLALVLLSGCVGHEVRHRTLEILRTTPIGSVRLVGGIQASRLLQLLLLSALNLPVLAVVRIWGGVSWEYLVAVYTVTLAALWLAASLSSFFSVICKRPSTAIFSAIVILVGIYLLRVVGEFSSGSRSLLLITNPYVAMTLLADMLTAPTSVGLTWAWHQHSLVVFGMGVVLQVLTVLCVVFFPLDRKPSISSSSRLRRLPRGGMRLVAWRDLGSRARAWGYIGTTILGLGLPMGVVIAVGFAKEWSVNILVIRTLCVRALYLVVVTHMAIVAAQRIGQEKDTRRWLELLSTSLSNGQILRGFIWAVCVRTIGTWLVFMASLGVFWWVMGRVGLFLGNVTHTTRLLLAMSNLGGYWVLALGIGLAAGIWMRQGMAAVLLTLAGLGLWYGFDHFGSQPLFLNGLWPWLVKHQVSDNITQSYLFYRHGLAAVQVGMGLFCLGLAQLSLRKGPFI